LPVEKQKASRTWLTWEVMTLFNVGFGELILILVIALVVFGPGKLPEVGKALGKSVREFKTATRGIQEQLDESDSTAGKSGKA
jgi:sec-independent protein translocase protein TatA